MPVLPVPMSLDALEFIRARNITVASGVPRPIDLIVVHTMEAPEKPKTARHVAEWFAGSQAPQASAHFCVDDEEVIQCVRVEDVAWAAPGANHDGVHIEHTGYAGQTQDQWDDDYSRSVLWNSALLAAELCQRFNIPAVKVDPHPPENGKAIVRGFCGHVDVTNWRNGGKGHQDPGAAFPWGHYLALVREFIGARPTDAPPPPALEV